MKDQAAVDADVLVAGRGSLVAWDAGHWSSDADMPVAT